MHLKIAEKTDDQPPKLSTEEKLAILDRPEVLSFLQSLSRPPAETDLQEKYDPADVEYAYQFVLRAFDACIVFEGKESDGEPRPFIRFLSIVSTEKQFSPDSLTHRPQGLKKEVVKHEWQKHLGGYADEFALQHIEAILANRGKSDQEIALALIQDSKKRNVHFNELRHMLRTRKGKQRVDLHTQFLK